MVACLEIFLCLNFRYYRYHIVTVNAAFQRNACHWLAKLPKLFASASLVDIFIHKQSWDGMLCHAPT